MEMADFNAVEFCLLEGINDGSRNCPVLSSYAQPLQKDLTKWRQDDAKAASIFVYT
jgi:hypothetical protein